MSRFGITTAQAITFRDRITTTITVWFPDSFLPEGFTTSVHEYISQLALDVVHRWKGWRGSDVIQAKASINYSNLLKLEEFAERCCSVVEGFHLQFGPLGIYFHNGESFQLYRLKEEQTPEIIEALWHLNLGFIIRGYYLNGSSIKEATEQNSTTLRTIGPPLQAPSSSFQVHGLLEELFVPTEGLDVNGKSLIFASKVVDVDGHLLTVRSGATFIVRNPIVHSRGVSEHSLGASLPKTLPFKMKIRSLLRFPACQPKTALRSKEELQSLVEYWKGVSESEMFDFRILFLQQLPAGSEVTNRNLSQCGFPTSMQVSSGDQGYWQRGLEDLNEVIRMNTNRSQSSLLFRILARTKLFLGQFESALQDFRLADELYTGRPSSTDMLERATAKCALVRYSEAMEDVAGAAAINPNCNDVKTLQTCLERILHLKLQDVIHGPDLPISIDNTRGIPDLLTGDKWSPDCNHRLLPLWP